MKQVLSCGACVLVFVGWSRAAHAQIPFAPDEGVTSSKAPWQMHSNGACSGSMKKKSSMYCRGGVLLTQEDRKISCDTMQIDLDENRKISKAFCLEHVVFMSKDGRTSSEKAEFDVVKNRLVLSGNAVLYQGDNEIHGEPIIYNMKDKSFRLGRLRAKLSAQGQNAALPGADKPQEKKP